MRDGQATVATTDWESETRPGILVLVDTKLRPLMEAGSKKL